jgi:hypothetical protein
VAKVPDHVFLERVLDFWRLWAAGRVLESI